MAVSSNLRFFYVVAAIGFLSVLVMFAMGIIPIIAAFIIAWFFATMAVVIPRPRPAEKRSAGSQLLQSNPAAILQLDLSGMNVIWANTAAGRFFSCEAEKLIARNIEELDFGYDASSIVESAIQAAQSGTVSKGCVSTGFGKHLMFVAAPMLEAENAASYEKTLLLSITDVSDLFSYNQKINDRNNIAAIQRIAGGVAHEFNNLLQVVVGYCELLQGESLDSHNADKYIAQICQAGKRGSRIVGRLLSFSSQRRAEPQLLDVENYLCSIEKTLEILFGAEIKISIKKSSLFDHALISVDKAYFEQIVINVCDNAVIAMENRGTLELKIRKIEIDAEYLCCHPEASDGSFIVLDIIDGGCGIAADKHTKVFEPFYSTSTSCIETGMGLPVAYGLARLCGGWIELDSQAGGPTRFSIFMPEAEISADKSTESTQALSANDVSKSLKILVCQDDRTFARLIAASLESVGHQVYMASDGLAAMAMLGKLSGDLDAVIVDPVLPAVNSARVKQRARQINKNLPIISLSSLDNEISFEKGFHTVDFTIEAIIEAVHSACGLALGAEKTTHRDNDG